MSTLRTRGAVVLLILVAAPLGPAIADCSDFAGPGVYWRRCLQDGQDLQNADLTGAVLRDGSFKRADLSGADLSNADARRAKFISTTLRGTILDRADLVRADLTNADLTGASLRETDLTMAKLFRANLTNADLTGARLEQTDLLNAELGGATWVDGTTVCAENSVGQCQRGTQQREVSGKGEPSG